MPVEMPLPEPMYPRLLRLHSLVTTFRDEIGPVPVDPPREPLREDLVARLNGWLYELKLIAIVIYRYEQDNAFFHANLLSEAHEAPVDAPTEHKFQYENNLVISALILDIQTFHLFTSTLLDKVARFLSCYYAGTLAGKFRKHDTLWNKLRDQAKYTFISNEARHEAKWLQDRADYFRNRAIVHPDAFEEHRLRPGIRSRQGENISRLYIGLDVAGGAAAMEAEAEAVNDIFHHLVLYVYEMVTICRKTRQLSSLGREGRRRK